MMELETYNELMATEAYSDFKLICDGGVFAVHKVVLATGSEFFKALLRNDCQETRDGVASLPEDRSDIIEAVLRYLYTGGYTVNQDHGAHTEARSKVFNNSASDRPNSSGRNHAHVTPKSFQSNRESDSTDIEVDEDPAALSTLALMRMLVEHYLAADKFGIIGLQDAALKQIFMTELRPLVNLWDFDPLVKHILLSTRPADHLRAFTIQSCVEFYDDMKYREAIDEHMEKHEPMAWMICKARRAPLFQGTSIKFKDYLREKKQTGATGAHRTRLKMTWRYQQWVRTGKAVA